MKKYCARFLATGMVICTFLSGCAPKAEAEAFSNWVDGAAPIAALEEYVEKVTDEKSDDFIPIEDRIAVFDLDGTL